METKPQIDNLKNELFLLEKNEEPNSYKILLFAKRLEETFVKETGILSPWQKNKIAFARDAIDKKMFKLAFNELRDVFEDQKNISDKNTY